MRRSVQTTSGNWVFMNPYKGLIPTPALPIPTHTHCLYGYLRRTSYVGESITPFYIHLSTLQLARINLLSTCIGQKFILLSPPLGMSIKCMSFRNCMYSRHPHRFCSEITFIITKIVMSPDFLNKWLLIFTYYSNPVFNSLITSK